MEMIEATIRFLNSYPIWAKISVVAGLLFSLLILIFAQRNEAADKGKGESQDAPKDGRVFLNIQGVKLFPDDPNAQIQVLAIVNGTTFEYPSVGGAKWMKVGPDMSPKLIELPRAHRYDIRFEMKLRVAPKLSDKGSKYQVTTLAGHAALASHAGSQKVSSITRLPYSEEYKLYLTVGETRDASVRAIIYYEVKEMQ